MSLGLVNVTAFRVQIKEVDEDNWSGSEVVEEDLVCVCSKILIFVLFCLVFRMLIGVGYGGGKICNEI